MVSDLNSGHKTLKEQDRSSPLVTEEVVQMK